MPAPAKALGLLCAILLAELLALTVWLDGAALAGRPGLVGQIGLWGAWILRFLVGFAAAFAAFAGMRESFTLQPLARRPPIQWSMLALHAASAAIFGILSASIYGNWQLAAPDLAAMAWLATGPLALTSLALAFYPCSVWNALLRPTGFAWIFAAAVSALGVAMVALSQSMWQSAAKLTFVLVQILLRPVLPNLIVQPERMRLQGHTFGVIISQECSGLEGIGLMLVFSAAWLWLVAKGLPVPASLAPHPRRNRHVVFPQRSPHRSPAPDWRRRSTADCGRRLSLPSRLDRLQRRRLRYDAGRPLGSDWFSLRPRIAAEQHENPTAAYLIPFLAILAAGMFTRAASANFEWLYGLRFVASAAALLVFRKRLLTLDWKFGAWGIAAGVAVFAVWVGLDQWLAIPAASMPPALATAIPSSRLFWITLRALAAITTVPIAEELAFRAFAMRRITSPDFEAVELQSASWLGVAISSVVFGLLHGDRWLAGILAGLAFALVARRTNRIGDAVIAHSIANALLAVAVLYFDRWQYW